MQILSDGTGGRISLLNEPMIRRMGEYMSRSYIGNGWVVNFADASAQGGGDPLLIYRFGKRSLLFSIKRKHCKALILVPADMVH